MVDVKWLPEPEAHDYPAALAFLSIIFKPAQAKAMVEDLRAAKMTSRKAKDILRGSGLPLVSKTDAHVAKAAKKMLAGEPLSPILLVRFGGSVIIADGYHRVCASYHLEDDTLIPCKIA